MHKEFEQDLLSTMYVHRPLPLHRERSLEAGFLKKEVLASRILLDGDHKTLTPTARGMGTVSQGEDAVTLRSPLRSDHWPEGAAPDGDYTNYGTAFLDFRFAPEDWQGFNRLYFEVNPKIRGARIGHVHAAVRNVGATPLPDPYERDGTTVFDLDMNRWNTCIWEFEAMPRDAITALTFFVLCGGHDIGAATELEYDFRNIRLEKVANPEHEHGWVNPNPGVRLSSVGYWPDSEKIAVCTADADCFRVVKADSGETVFEGPIVPVTNERGSFQVMDFSPVTQEGAYRLEAGSVSSCVFDIAKDLAKESLWRAINFLFCERCGFPVPGRHSTCHQDALVTHNGETISLGGGWHDAGDVSQQVVQSGELVQALFENARHCKDDPMLYLRLMEEAQWGLDFIMRTRFGDGFRGMETPATRNTDNKMGNFDDIIGRVHDHSFENFLFSGIEAYAAETLQGFDDALASNALHIAEEDFAFAVKKFAETGVDPTHMFEHTYNSGPSQYYAVQVWSASCLYAAAGNEDYAAYARQAAEKLLACQEKGSDGVPTAGFFYRDETHKSIVHFNHQSREHQFMQALERLCTTQPDAPEKPRWEKAMGLYGHYLKFISANTAPYGMLPAGIHRTDEADDRELFSLMHLMCTYEGERENYLAQLASGRQLGNGYVLKNFPVWFSFRGNSAVLLSMGKAASCLGRYFKDPALLQLGREQMYWMWGKNPFGQSLIYGAGDRWCRQYGVWCGESVGEMPVGVETCENEDVPFWPQNNNATFREVWVGSVGRWLQLCADVL